jgi:hypothetical protein
MEGSLDRPFPGNDYVQLSGEGLTLCALTARGSIECPAATTEIRGYTPRAADFVAVAAGSQHACGLHGDGSVSCWGLDGGGGEQVTGPNAESVHLRQVAAGGSATCVLRETGTIRCWGADAFGAVAGANADHSSDFTAVYVGAQNVCAIHAGGAAVCWGAGHDGQLELFGQPGGANGFADLSIGTGVICGLRADTSAICSGSDVYGQASAVRTAGTGIARVIATAAQTCLVFEDGTMRCYGEGQDRIKDDPWTRK